MEIQPQFVDHTQAETIVAFLSRKFGVKAPKVKFHGRGGGHYKEGFEGWKWNKKTEAYTIPFTQHATIVISPSTRLTTVAHEFAHHLDACTNGYQKEHGESFYFNLRRTISAIGMNYDWSREYGQVKRWARRDGLWDGVEPPPEVSVPKTEEEIKADAEYRHFIHERVKQLLTTTEKYGKGTAHRMHRAHRKAEREWKKLVAEKQAA